MKVPYCIVWKRYLFKITLKEIGEPPVNSIASYVVANKVYY